MLLVKGLLFFVAVVFLISGLDDILIDIHYLTRSLYRKFFVHPKYKLMTEEQLVWPVEQPIAVMIPAWNESAILYHMVENTILALNYSNYHIFIGAYPNDPYTQREVARLQEKYDNVRCIITAGDGPTNKADCLNWIYRGILEFEKANNITFAVFVMEDAEDIIHPLALKLFNYLIPRKDMVQLPVVPLEPLHWYNLTVGHYIDEFAENHYKNMVIREALGRGLPSAGVGSAFSRRALEVAAEKQNGIVFGMDSLCEDYEAGMRLKDYGIDRQIFVKLPIIRTVIRKQFLTGKQKEVRIKEFIAIKERFPDTLSAAIRQKSRWIIGIALQGWKNLGWKGDLTKKLILMRDRKGLLTSQVNMLGYIVFVFITLYWLCIEYVPELYRYPAFVEEGTLLWYIIIADTFFMAVRFAERCYCVQRVYNFKRTLLSIPGFVWGNLINYLATCRALAQYGKYLVTGKWIAWDHTKHALPTEKELQVYRRRLGEISLSRKFITREQLDLALEEQKKTGRKLGEILLKSGFIKERELVQALGVQFRVSTAEIDPYETPVEAFRLLPKQVAVKYSIYPKDIKDNKALIAVNEIPTRSQIDEINRIVQRPVEFVLTIKGNLHFAIARGYARLSEASGAVPKLGQLLLERNLVTGKQLDEALRIQRETYLRLGDLLLEEGYLEEGALEAALQNYDASGGMRFGDYLVYNDLISQDQLVRTLGVQLKRRKRLGAILVENNIITKAQLKSVLSGAENENNEK